MIDRGIIKWQPFDSCFSSTKILTDVYNKKNKEIFPILSDDQLNILEEKIKDAYYLKETINIIYYYNDKIISMKGKINSINVQDKIIYLDNKTIYFKQILNIL